MTHAAHFPRHRRTSSVGSHLFNGLRGALIGTAEVIPGVSGGTVALIIGVYERLISSAGHVLSGIKLTVSERLRGRGGERANAEFRQAHWAIVIAALIGMFLALGLAMQLLAPVLENYRAQASAVFFGLVLASLWVPYTQSGGRWHPKEWVLAVLMAGVAFFLTSLPTVQGEPGTLAVMGAAAVAISGLVLPGLSGAFLLEVLGVYEPAIQAGQEFDLAFIGTFAAGALMGLVVIVKVLQWLLEHYHRVTLVVITGLMAGALRALWPWQPWDVDGDRSLLAPTTDLGVLLALMAAGFILVVTVLVIEHRMRSSSGSSSSGSSSRQHKPGKHERPAAAEADTGLDP